MTEDERKALHETIETSSAEVLIATIQFAASELSKRAEILRRSNNGAESKRWESLVYAWNRVWRAADEARREFEG
jgi:hypothetical protein